MMPNSFLRPFGKLALLAGIEVFDRAAQFGQIGADAGILVHRADRPVEEAVGHARRRP
jgi:predicted hotdog family 3-hydroxylacyl-ACP dehydratase